jgi:hypothetical protein
MKPLEVRSEAFKDAYRELSKESALLCRTCDGRAEVWETDKSLLTIVMLDKEQFWTKTRLELGEEKYGEARDALTEARP